MEVQVVQVVASMEVQVVQVVASMEVQVVQVVQVVASMVATIAITRLGPVTKTFILFMLDNNLVWPVMLDNNL
jgi:hypothetical protein